MKFIALILSVYILALNFAPCEDSGTLDNDIKIEISQHVDEDNSNTGLDLCSHFCQCHCCHIHVTYFNLSEFTVVSNNISTKLFSHFDNLGKEIPNPILQPPRV